jgi:hypothetical protein
MEKLQMRYAIVMAFLLGLISAGLAASSARAGEARNATLFKDPQCSCCEGYADYLRGNGFDVKVVNTHDLSMINEQHGVPTELQGCHVTIVDGYVVGGHVPVNVIKRLLSEKPAITGITLPGMPNGSPGMYGKKTEPFQIYEIGKGSKRIYATE